MILTLSVYFSFQPIALVPTIWVTRTISRLRLLLLQLPSLLPANHQKRRQRRSTTAIKNMEMMMMMMMTTRMLLMMVQARRRSKRERSLNPIPSLAQTESGLSKFLFFFRNLSQTTFHQTNSVPATACAPFSVIARKKEQEEKKQCRNEAWKNLQIDIADSKKSDEKSANDKSSVKQFSTKVSSAFKLW